MSIIVLQWLHTHEKKSWWMIFYSPWVPNHNTLLLLKAKNSLINSVNITFFFIQVTYCCELCRKTALDEYHQVLCMGPSRLSENNDHPLARLQETWRWIKVIITLDVVNKLISHSSVTLFNLVSYNLGEGGGE